MVSSVTRAKNIAMTRLPLSKDVSLIVLGVFHTLCMAIISLIPMLNVYNPQISGSRLDFGVALIIANVVVAVGITAPISGHKPSGKWTSLWGLWLLIGYVLVSLVVYGTNFRTLEIGNTQWSDALTLCTGNAELLLGLLISGVLAILVGVNRKTQVLGLTHWIGVLLLITASYRNDALMWIPSYLLIFMGGYVAYGALGSSWFVKAITVVTAIVAVPSIMIIYAFIHNLSVRVSLTDLLWLYSAPVNPIRNKMHAFCSCYMLTFPAITFALVVGAKKLWGKALLSILLLVQMAGLICTGRRAAFTGLVLMIILSAVWLFRARAKTVLISALVVILLVALLDGVGVVRIHNYFMVRESTYEHMVNGKSGLATFVTHPIFGAGFGHHKENGNVWALSNHVGVGHIFGHAHNDYIELLESGGIVGFLLAFLAGIQIILAGKRLRVVSKSREGRFIIAGFTTQIVACSVTSALMFGQFLHPHYLIPASIMMTALLGSLWTEEELQSVSSDSQERELVCEVGVGV